MAYEKILILDDSVTIRQQIKHSLSVGQYDILEGMNGAEGLRLLAENADVRLIVCDVFMPQVDGMQFLAQIKDKNLKIPIIMLTTEQRTDKIQFARDAGVRAWLIKPFMPEKLAEIVRKYLD